MVATIQQAREYVYKYLQMMNRNPTSLNISSFDTDKMPWLIEGEFQSGFLGDTYTYEARFDPGTHLITKFKVTGTIQKQDSL